MNREEKIKKIYEKVANKELTLWCKVKYGDTEWVEHFYIWEWDFWWKLLWKETTIEWYASCSIETEEWEEIENMWHYVMLWDVFDFHFKLEYNAWSGKDLETRIRMFDDFNSKAHKIYMVWEEKRKPIDEQSDKCIDLIYDLIKE